MTNSTGTSSNDTIRTVADGGSLGSLPNTTDTGDSHQMAARTAAHPAPTPSAGCLCRNAAARQDRRRVRRLKPPGWNLARGCRPPASSSWSSRAAVPAEPFGVLDALR